DGGTSRHDHIAKHVTIYGAAAEDDDVAVHVAVSDFATDEAGCGPGHRFLGSRGSDPAGDAARPAASQRSSEDFDGVGVVLVGGGVVVAFAEVLDALEFRSFAGCGCPRWVGE